MGGAKDAINIRVMDGTVLEITECLQQIPEKAMAIAFL